MTTPDGATTNSSADRAAQLRADLKKLNSTATRLKLDLHDLAEDLPIGWERILDLANLTYSAYAAIARLQSELAKEVPQ